MEQVTKQKQDKERRIFTDTKFMAIIVQRLFNKVHKKLKSGSVKQSYADLHDVMQDLEVALDAAKFLNIEKFGDVTKDQFIANKDPKVDNISS